MEPIAVATGEKENLFAGTCVNWGSSFGKMDVGITSFVSGSGATRGGEGDTSDVGGASSGGALLGGGLLERTLLGGALPGGALPGSDLLGSDLLGGSVFAAGFSR